MSTMLTTNWTIDVEIQEAPDRTIATAMARMPNGRELRGVGHARRNPSDRPVARIGEEVACSRALSQLAREMSDMSANEIEMNARRGDPVA